MEYLHKKRIPARRIVEEVFSSSIHGLAALAAIVGLIIGLVQMSESATSAKVSFIIYCASLIILMTMSSLYHALIFSKAKRVFQILDHSAIFLLIAGSYTPFVVHLFSGWQLAVALITLWTIAALGIVFKAALPKKMQRASVGLYIGFGWLAVFLAPKISHLGTQVTILLIAGGVLYTVGAGIMKIKKPFTHVGWHMMVVAAASSHYFAITQLVRA